MVVLKPLAGDSAEAPKQFNQPSRKGKKAWRKNVDVTEVQKGLEERVEQIIQGGIVSEKASEDLFAIDVAGDKEIAKRLPKKLKTLRADEIISQRSAVPAVSLRKRPGEGLGVTDGVLPEKRQRTGGKYVTQKELARIRKVADGVHENTVHIEEATYDPWSVAAPTSTKIAPAVSNDDFSIRAPAKPQPPPTLHKKPIPLTANGKAPAAVPKPKGGYSYNPAFSDYEQRLQEESDKAVETEMKRLAALEADRLRAEAAARSAAEAEAAEARADMSEWDEDSAWEGLESGGEELLSVKAKRPERKTQAQRNKIKRRKEEERRKAAEERQRKKDEQAKRIEELADEVVELERARELEKLEMSDDDSDVDDNELRRKQLGKFRLPEKDLELVLPDELQDSLRLLKPEGNLLKDRYRSLLVRGKLEARRNIPFRKKANKKVTEKWTYKDFRI
ncbi:ribosome biogenesis protein Nop53/GLTSCR2 [Coniochaeta sp. 2T2.1]|nr:ribosome biogenesis protein Nop53/GLTSCR2 [Coniochaeta sp. 2T2.1]